MKSFHLKTAVITVLALGVGAAVGAVIFAATLHVGADRRDPAVVTWLMHQTMRHSVQHHAKDVKLPAGFGNPDQVAMGAMHYKAMCVSCHLGPGVRDTELRQGLNPLPPQLAEVAARWTPEETYWIIKHGVRMTAMPAWGKTHSDAELWALTAFIKTGLPRMTAAQFRAVQMEMDDE